MKKQAVLDLVQEMTDEIDTEDLMYRLYVLHKIEVGEKALEDGDVISHEEFVRRSEAWLE